METKDNETNAGSARFGCCNPENFKEMFENMCECFPGSDGFKGFPSMEGGMMKRMMEVWCPFDIKDMKKGAKHKKRPIQRAETKEREADGS